MKKIILLLGGKTAVFRQTAWRQIYSSLVHQNNCASCLSVMHVYES
jgi:hypothetical protein